MSYQYRPQGQVLLRDHGAETGGLQIGAMPAPGHGECDHTGDPSGHFSPSFIN